MRFQDLTEAELAEHPESQHLGLVYKLAGEFWHKHCREDGRLDLGDLVSVGWMSLRRAWKTFDPVRGYTFSTLATQIITRAFWELYNTAGPGLAVPRSTRQLATRHKDKPPGTRQCKSIRLALLAMFGEKCAMPFLYAQENESPRADELAKLSRCLKRLSAAHREVLESIFIRGETITTYADARHCSRQRAHQIKAAALKRLISEWGDR